MEAFFGWRTVLDVIFPRSCYACKIQLFGDLNPCFCQVCWGGLQRLNGPSCPSCGIPFASALALLHSPTHRCGNCRETPPRFDRAVSMGTYEGILAKAIQLFKYQGKTHLAGPLGEILSQGMEKLPEVDCLVPVPLDSTRLHERQYNQALLLCDAVRRKTGVEVIPDGLERIRETKPQTGLPLEDRRRNVRKAFSVKRPLRIKDRRVLLVDDVLTTAATVNECARTLKKAGAKSVNVLTLARVVLS